MKVLQVKNLTKTFKTGIWPFKRETFSVVNDISFDLEQGEILGLLGPNGAGKTTIIQMLLGTLFPSEGLISYFGQNFMKHRISALKRIGYASGYDKLPARLSVKENLHIIGRIYGMERKYRQQQIKKLLTFFGIWDLRNVQTGTLSAGQSTRVMLVKAFMSEPDIILLDEPTASLDLNIAHEIRQFILMQRKERKVSILLTSHNMNEVTELCDRVLVLKKGRIIANNTPEELAGSISKVNIHLTVLEQLSAALEYLNTLNLIYTAEDDHLKIEVEEQDIASFLIGLSERRVIYSHISIDKPTLEDYFLSVSK